MRDFAIIKDGVCPQRLAAFIRRNRADNEQATRESDWKGEAEAETRLAALLAGVALHSLLLEM